MSKRDYEYLIDKVFIGDDGFLYSKPKKIKTTKNKYGYITFNFGNKTYLEHITKYVLHYGYRPYMIDHINGDRSDNRIENIRPSDQFQNQHNRKIGKDNKSGIKGVNWDKFKNKWRAQISYRHKKYYLGMYSDAKTAEKIVVSFRKKLHKEYANNG